LSVLSTQPTRTETGLGAGLIAYVLWGFLPLLFELLRSVGAETLVAGRTLFALLFVGAVLVIWGRMAEVRAVLTNGRMVRSLMLAALFLAANWLIYVYAVDTDQVLEASFGYFINPMVNVALGMLFLGEKLNRWQALAVAIALVALGVQALGLGHIPVIALGLAVSFALYGFIRKTAPTSSAVGLFVETLLLSPIAALYLLVHFAVGHAAFDMGTLWLLALTGPATAVPLLAFAFAVQRLTLTSIGMLQYIAPSIAFLLAATVLGEPLNPLRLISFGLIWLSLVVYTADSFVRRRRAALATQGV
jgi:chloramphenicol-sensitive protein RarD